MNSNLTRLAVRFSAASVLLGFLVGGCAMQNPIQPSKTTTGYYENDVKSKTQIADSIGIVAKAINPTNVDVQSDLAALKKTNATLRQDMETLREEADRANKEALAKFANLLSAFSGAGPYLDIVANAIKSNANAVTSEKTQPGGDIAKLVATAVEQAKANTNDKVQAVEGTLNDKVSKAKQEFNDQIEKLSALTETQKKDLLKNIEVVGKERRLSEPEIKALKDKAESGDFKGLLLTGGASAGVGALALLRTLGKSRSQSQIDQTATNLDNAKDTIESAQENLDKVKNSLADIKATQTAHSHALDIIKGGLNSTQSHVIELDRRVTRVEK